MNPRVSVIIPVYNPGVYLQQCLESIIHQTYTNLEIILIDDGSTDGSAEICDSYVYRDKRIKCIHQKNSGVSAARNNGLRICTGDYVHMPDSDDYLELNTYELLLNMMSETKVDCVVFEYFIDFADKEIIHTNNLFHYGEFSGIDSQEKIFSGFQFVCTKFIKRSKLEGLFFREDIHRGEDTLFAASAMLKCDKVLFIKTPLYHYVQSNNSACRGKFRRSQLTIIKLYDAYAILYKKYPRHLYNVTIRYLHDNIIMIYYDMWAEDRNLYKNEMKDFRIMAHSHFYQAIRGSNHSLAKLLKFSLFQVSPSLFCLLHSKIHSL